MKICGIRDVATAKWVAALGPDAIGLNFYARSARVVDEETAREIVGQLPAEVEPIGLFVNHSAAEVVRACERVGLRTVQIHGDEPVAMLAELAREGLEIVRAVRVDEETGLSEVAALVLECAARQVPLRGCLIDARVSGAYGGTGRSPPWERVRAEYRCDYPPLILAGGLRPENVAEAIAATGAWGVDVAGGVERGEGCKDRQRVQQFILAARGG